MARPTGGRGLALDLKRLLPADSRAVCWSRELETAVGGYFSLIFDGDDEAALDRAVLGTARAVAALPEVRALEYRNPVVDHPGLYAQLDSIVSDETRRCGVWSGISGSLRTKVDTYAASSASAGSNSLVRAMERPPIEVVPAWYSRREATLVPRSTSTIPTATGAGTTSGPEVILAICHSKRAFDGRHD